MGAVKKSRAGKGAKGASSARKKTSARKAAKKTTRKRAAKKTTAKKRAAKKTTAKKRAPKKTTKKTGRKSSAKKTPRKTSAKKAAAKKSTRKKTAQKKTTRKKTAKATAGRAAAPPKRRVRPAKLDRKTLAGIKEKLETEKLELEAQLEEIQRDSVSESEDTGLHDDFADAGTSTFERERDLSIRNNVLDLLDQVTRALVRIDEGGYGTCENCGRPIDAARIRAFPRVLLCLDCKRRDERTR